MRLFAGTRFTHIAARLGCLLLLMGALSSARRSLSCDVIPGPDGFEYRLSEDPGPDCDDRSWEDVHKTSLSQGSAVDQVQVHNVTNRSLFLKLCLNYTYFSGMCPGFVEASCSFNCSSTKPAVQICVGRFCFDRTSFILVTSAFVLLIAVGFAALCCFYKHKKRRGRRDLLRRAQELDQPTKNGPFPLWELEPLQDPDRGKPDAPDSSHAPSAEA